MLKHTNILFLCMIIFFFACSCSSITIAKSGYTFYPLTQDDMNEPKFLLCTILGETYGIVWNKNQTIPKKNNIRGKILIPLKEDNYIEKLQYCLINNDILFLYEFTDSESAATRLVLFDRLTLKKKWIIDFPGFNASIPLVYRESMYLSVMGTVAKFRISDGGMIWKHNDIVNNGTCGFNAFLSPELKMKKIYFTEDPLMINPTCRPRTVVCDEISGKIIKIHARK